MQVTLTVRGILEEDPAMQEIVSVLYRKSSGSAGSVVAGEADPEAPAGPAPAYVEARGAEPTPEDESEPQATADPAPKPKPQPKAVSVEDVRKAAIEAMNKGKRDGVTAVLNKYGGGSLKDVPEADLPATLAEIEAL